MGTYKRQHTLCITSNNINGYVYPRVKLPNSKIKIQAPQYRINVGVTDKIGSGVVPDVKIDNKFKLIKGKDGVLTETIRLINNNEV